MLSWRLESVQCSYTIFCIIQLLIKPCVYTCFVYLQPFCVTLDLKLFIDSIHILFLLYLLLCFWDFIIKNLQDFIIVYRALVKDIFLGVHTTSKASMPAFIGQNVLSPLLVRPILR